MKKKIISMVLTIAMLASLFAVVAMANTDQEAEAKRIYYVSKTGNDSNSGTIDSPFATIEKARDTIRELKQTSGLPNGGVTVYIREGVYEREASLEFTEEDSGEEGKRITYAAYPGEKVEITGGKYLKGSDFKKITDPEILDRLYPEVRDKIVGVNLKDYGFTDMGTWVSGGKTYEPWELAGETNRDAVPGLMIFVDDVPLDIARVPNRIKEGKDREMWDYFSSGKQISSKTGDKGLTFVYTDDRIEKWKNYEDVAVYGFWSTSWKIESSVIDSVDFDKKQITLKHPLSSGTAVGRRYIYLNVLDELDSEDEYYIDKKTGMLYMYARDDLAKTNVGITKFGRDGKEDFLIYLNGASNITLRGLEVTLARTTGIFIKHGENNLVDQCEVKNHGRTSVAIGAFSYGTRSKGTRGLGAIYTTAYMNHLFDPMSREDYVNGWKTYNNGLTNSVIKNTGSYGVFMAGGDIVEVEPANNYVYNCDISYTGRYESALCMAVDLSGMGNTVSHCSIHDNPASAFLVNGCDLIMEYNDIYRNCIDNSDYGVFYSCGWINEQNLGTEIRYNFIRDVPNTDYPGDALSGENGIASRQGIYNDNGQPFLDVHHNVFYNIPRGVFQAGGPENNIFDNIFIDVLRPIEIHGEDGVCSALRQGKSPFWALGYTNFFNPLFTENEKWKEKYPIWEKVRQDYLDRGMDAFQPASNMSDNVMIFYNYPEYKTSSILKQTIYVGELHGDYCKIENNYVTSEDIGFVDIDRKDFRLKENAKIFETHPDLKSIDVSKMGYNKNRCNEVFENSVMLKINSESAYSFGKRMFVDSQNTNVAPIIKDSRTLVPVRFISESFGCDVSWEESTQTVTVKKDGKTVEMSIGENKISINGEDKELDVPAQIIESRTMVPLRALTEALQKNVTWDDRGLIVITDMNIDADSDKAIIDNFINYNF